MYVNRCLCAISIALLAAATKACSSTHNWNVSSRVVAELNYRTPLFSSSSPPDSKLPSIRKESCWWRCICLFIRNLDKPQNVLKRQEIRVVTGSDLCCTKRQQTLKSEISLHLSGAPRSRSHDQQVMISDSSYQYIVTIIIMLLLVNFYYHIVTFSVLLWPVHLHVQCIVVTNTPSRTVYF